jgi:nucleoside-diphosphate-sugar epimerase
MKTDGVIPGRYVVLGGSGLIGSHVLLKLANQPGVDVVSVSCSREPQVNAPNIRSVKADVRIANSLCAILEGSDFVIYSAGVLTSTPVLKKDPVSAVLDNLRIGSNVLEAVYRSGCRQLVWISSTTGYPVSEKLIVEGRMFEGDPPDHWFGIGWTTRFLEKQCQWYADKIDSKMRVVVLRPTMVYGEYQDFGKSTAHFLPSLIRRVVDRENPIEVWGSGEQLRELIYSGDVAKAIIASTHLSTSFAAFNISGGPAISVNDCLSLILKLEGCDGATQIRYSGHVSGGATHNIDCSLADIELNFTPDIGVAEGFARTIEWYKENHAE